MSAVVGFLLYLAKLIKGCLYLPREPRDDPTAPTPACKSHAAHKRQRLECVTLAPERRCSAASATSTSGAGTRASIATQERQVSPGALDAVCMMYTNSKLMKETMLPHAGSWSMNEFIPIAGQATADNVAPAIGQIQYTLRAPNIAMCDAAFSVLDRNAEQIAGMTHCTVEAAWVARTRAGLPNKAMAEITFRNFEKLGAPQWGEEAKAFAREMQKNLGLEPMEEPFVDKLLPELKRVEEEAIENAACNNPETKLQSALG